MENGNQLKGFLLAILAATLWGVSGTFGQFVFSNRGVDPAWLVTVRCLSSGLILLALGYFRFGLNIFNIWKSNTDILALLIFGLIGIPLVQYTYFAAIQHSNAATATVLQYAGPALIAIYLAIVNKRLPGVFSMLAIVLAIAGTFLLVTHGSFNSLSISGLALFWGINSAVALAFYSIQPIKLLHRYHAIVVIGWAMLIGGIAFSFVRVPWQVEGTWDLDTYISTAFIIFLGSVVAFYAYLSAVKWIGAQTTSLLASAEPLSAALISVFWLKVSFGSMDILGSVLILLAIFLLARK
ncbi:DMT family transporter [Pedobacter rhizosphaerae]|uniref:Threonine/homoserine efflux transporter RhtA n=1 Tax=Pedobacter rhizosphaerae TaxID=390241 RepID=A0A1H9VKL1_9SPHI|nr:DMT family transporter [Pedobacter rhizosphaerae]SES22051.1 Threonine/homoserine efflux transporter RhtA [Pedobacter rhizosphaerae]